MPHITPARERKKQYKRDKCRYYQLKNKLLDIIYNHEDWGGDISDHLSTRRYTTFYTLEEKWFRATVGSKNWKRLLKYINRIKREAIRNFTGGELGDYTHWFNPSDSAEYYRVRGKLYGY